MFFVFQVLFAALQEAYIEDGAVHANNACAARVAADHCPLHAVHTGHGERE
jgi:hypothetical protein